MIPYNFANDAMYKEGFAFIYFSKLAKLLFQHEDTFISIDNACYLDEWITARHGTTDRTLCEYELHAV